MSTGNRAIAVQSGLGLVVVLAIGIAAAFSYHRPGRQPATITAGQLAHLLHATGLTPEPLAASGVTAQQTTAIITRMRQQAPQLASQLISAEQAYEAAYREHDRLERLVRSGTATAQDVTALTASAAALQTARSDLSAVVQGALEEAAAVIGANAAATIGAVRNTSDTGLAIPYRVIARSSADWVALRNAVAARDIRTRLGELPPARSVALIASAEADPAVAAARVSLELNSAAVATAWNQAVGG